MLQRGLTDVLDWSGVCPQLWPALRATTTKFRIACTVSCASYLLEIDAPSNFATGRIFRRLRIPECKGCCAVQGQRGPHGQGQ
jgi:hypothetical protein